MINSYPFYPQNYYPPPPFYPQNIKPKSIRNNYNNSQTLNKTTNTIKNRNTCKQSSDSSKNIKSKLHKSTPFAQQDKSPNDRNCSINAKYDETVMFELFGIKLHQDDILLICLIFFLYNEGIKDEFLFIALILLLLS